MHASYKEVKNVIHNEFGISRDDILVIIRDMVRDEIQRFIIQGAIESNVANVVGGYVRQQFGSIHSGRSFQDVIRKEISAQIADTLTDKMQINLSFKEGN